MAMPPIQWQEPQVFAAGDSLVFQRNLPDYKPSDGWQLVGTVSKAGPNGAVRVAQFASQPDATNSFHCVNVPQFLAGVDSGVYILSEEIVNQAQNVRHQVYFFDGFVVGADFQDGLAGGRQKTRAQEMLELLYDSYKGIIQQKFQETDVQRSRFLLKRQEDVLADIKYWEDVRENELARERIRNGRPSGAVTEPVLSIG